MSKKLNIEERKKALELQSAMLDVYAEILYSLREKEDWECDHKKVTDGYYEKYLDDEGVERSKWYPPTYECDEDGKPIPYPPSEDDYRYMRYQAILAVRDEIEKLIK